MLTDLPEPALASDVVPLAVAVTVSEPTKPDNVPALIEILLFPSYVLLVMVGFVMDSVLAVISAVVDPLASA